MNMLLVLYLYFSSKFIDWYNGKIFLQLVLVKHINFSTKSCNLRQILTKRHIFHFRLKEHCEGVLFKIICTLYGCSCSFVVSFYLQTFLSESVWCQIKWNDIFIIKITSICYSFMSLERDISFVVEFYE